MPSPHRLRRRSEPGGGVSRPVGRVLCTRVRGPAAIHLGLPLPAASCGLPAGIGRAALKRSRRLAGEPADPLDLAPGGVYRAAAVTCGAGGLLHHRFTLTPAPSRRRGGLFSVALSRGSPRVGVTDHPALWSPDLPRRTCVRSAATARPTHPPLRIRGGHHACAAGAQHAGVGTTRSFTALRRITIRVRRQTLRNAGILRINRCRGVGWRIGVGAWAGVSLQLDNDRRCPQLAASR